MGELAKKIWKKINFLASLKSLKKGVGSGSIGLRYPRIRIRTKMSRIPNNDKDSLTGTGYLVECTHVEVQALVNPGPRLSILRKKIL
jgi:hypothetical protein